MAGYLIVESQYRGRYLDECKEVVAQGRRAPGCLDFAITPDLVDPRRVDIFELWESQAAVDAFRGSGPSAEQQGSIVEVSVCEYDVSSERPLT